MMRIDAHAHAMHADRGPDGKFIPPLRPAWTPGPKTPREYVAESRAAGIEKLLILDPPEVTFKLCDIFGDYIMPAPQVNLDAASAAEIDALLQRGACGIKFIAPARPYCDDAYLPLYDVIRAHGALAVFHTGYLGMGLHEPDGLLPGKTFVDITHMRPAALDRIARALPGLKMLMAHFGNPWWEEAWKIISSHKCIYADFSGGTAYRRSMNMWREIFMPNGHSDTAAIAKLCFATDAGYCHQDIPLQGAKQTAFYDSFFDNMRVPDDLRMLVNRGNILRLAARGSL